MYVQYRTNVLLCQDTGTTTRLFGHERGARTTERFAFDPEPERYSIDLVAMRWGSGKHSPELLRLGADKLKVRLDHLFDHLLERDLGFPTEHFACFRRVTN